MKAWKGLQPGQAISASEYSRLCKAVFESYGTGAAKVSIANGRMQIHVDADSNDHPFKINGRLNSTGTAVLVTISNGSFEFRTPLFYGSTGDPLSDDPAPEYTIAASPDVYYVYFVVTVDKNGLLADAQDVWIEIDDTLPTSVAPVPDDMPNAGDTGTDGTLYIQIGTLTIAVDGSDVTFAAFNDIQTNLTFWMCDGEYTLNSIS